MSMTVGHGHVGQCRDSLMNWIKIAYTYKPSKEDKGKVSVWAIINILFHKQINKTSPSKPKPRAKVQAHTCNPSLWDVDAAESEVHS